MLLPRALAILTTCIFLGGCSTDLELTAPYQDITVVYGLISKNANDGVNEQTRHYLKINKAFLGDGDALVYALVPDSSEYTDESLPQQDRYVEDIDNGAQYPLIDTLMPRDPGIFNSPLHKMYYFDASLDQDHSYKVVVRVKGSTIEATTPVVNNISYVSGFLSENGTNRLNLFQGGEYKVIDMKYRSGADGKRFDVFFRVRYAEDRGNGDIREENYRYKIGTTTSSSVSGNEELQLPVNGLTFFETLVSMMENDASINRRIFRGLDIEFEVADIELTTYLRLTEPISGIVEERPEYTNITNGYGLFASRHFQTSRHIRLGPDTYVELVEGAATSGLGDLNFCVDPAPWVTDPDVVCN
ncbi:MAG: DUF4249 family protein [Flavobacteriales bacterium]|nr:DUF4249 family protein [Flavobacteriales bacterium]